MLRSITVELGARSYEIHIGSGLVDELGAHCRALKLGPACLVATDTNVRGHYGDRCLKSLRAAGFQASLAELPPGESSKDQAQLATLYSAALKAGLDRRSFFVALGGGVVGDLAGFAAATFLRGVPCVQVPTTVVAMVDSAVGGKTGINLPEGKNLVGAFHQPAAVIADRNLLRTLPDREYVSGLAEVIKYGVIRDADLFALLEKRSEAVLAKEPELLDEIIERSCRIKAAVVAADEREGGLRAILNYGHTLGHALEKVAGYGEFLHGEAIAVGMAYAGAISMREKGFPPDQQKRVLELLARLALPVRAPKYSWNDLREAIGVDKKVRGGVPRLVLAEAIGRVQFGCEVPESALREAWENL